MPEYDAGTVKATMVADSKGLHGGIEAAKKDMQSLQDEAKRVKDSWRDMGFTAGVSFAAITAGIWKATQANNQLKASMMGLDSIAKGTIGTYSKIEAELAKIKNDGMIPLTNAIAAYKNLLMRYEDEETAITMFKRLADAAAFGRQGQLSLGEAIQGATEGLKNENSVLVDNAGVTKNVSQMWKDYAASIGKTIGQLTDAEKRQAEINGIIEETRYQVGDLAKLQNSLSGEMSKANAEANQVAAAYGDALEPALSKVIGGYSALMKNIREFIQTSPGMVAGITAGAAAMTGLVSITSAWIALDIGKKIAAGFSALTGPVGIAMISLSALTSIIVGITTEIKKQRDEQRKQAESYRNQAKEVDGLISEYEDLSKKANKTANEKQRLVDLSNKIAEILPNAVTGYDKEGNAIISVNSALREMILLKGQELRINQNILRDEIRSDERAKKRAEDRKKELQETWNLMIGKWGSAPDKIEDPLLRRRAKELEEEYNRELRKTNDEINRLATNITNKKQQIQDIDELITTGRIRQTIKKPGITPPSKSTKVAKYSQEQADLEAKLYIERLERLKQFREAEIEEEKQRYKSEHELAKGNKKLLEAVEQGHIERLKAIDDKYAQQKLEAEQAQNIKVLQLQADLYEARGELLRADLLREQIRWRQELNNADLTAEQIELITQAHYQRLAAIRQEYYEKGQEEEDKKQAYLFEQNQISLEEYRAYLERRLARYEEYSDEWYSITQKIAELDNQLNKGFNWKEFGEEFNKSLKDNLVDGLAEAVVHGKTLQETFSNILKILAEMTLKKAILQPLIDGLFGGFGSAHGGALITPTGLIPSYHSGGIAGVVPNLQPDERIIKVLTGERILNRQETQAYNAGLAAGAAGGNMNVSVNMINQTSQPATAMAGNPYFDGDKWVIDVILKDFNSGGPTQQIFGGRR